MRVRRLAGPEQLLAVRDDDFARAHLGSHRVASCWALGERTVGWVTASRRFAGGPHLSVLGPGEEAAELLTALAGDHGISSTTLPRGADGHLAACRLAPRHDWDWFLTRTPPPPQPLEPRVGWLPVEAGPEVVDLLRTWSPRHDAEPGEPTARRWAGARDDAGTLVAAVTHTEDVGGVPHLASVVTHGRHRGRGYGGAVTAWITRVLLAEGHPLVTLGMYADNDVARRLYLRLGFADTHHLTSGRLQAG